MSTSGNRPDIAEIYAEAPEGEDSRELEAYLAEACGDDVVLRARVEQLLEARARRGSFFDSQSMDRTALYDKQAEHVISSTIGPYRLLEEIGEGGMGLVYMAEQIQPVRRRVALKVIKPGMDSRQVIARFNAERQALALMDHANICRVFDAGATEAGRPYFVMELVRGLAITDYCDRERLTIRQRLELFVLVCRAVQHAHQKGIIHRDIKPSNILVSVIDGVAIPKIIDFGIAKATSPSLAEGSFLTGFHQFIGTPLYMSPEQADLSGVDVDTRSDIYALGVLLYELLTGTTPILEETFRAAGPASLRKLISEAETPPPSSRLSTLNDELRSTASANRQAEPRPLSLSMRGELDWIVMKALEKDRQRRYETAAALADEVVRHLNDEPVEACPPSRRYRLGKFVRRHRSGIAAATAISIALILGFAATLWQAARATIAAERAQAAERAEGVALAQAREAVDQMFTKVAEKWLAEHGTLTDIQRDLLENALAFYERFAAQADDDFDIKYEALRARMRVAGIRLRLGNKNGAEQGFRDAIDEASRLVAKDQRGSGCRIELVKAREALVEILRESGRAAEAEKHLEDCLDEVAPLDWQTLDDLSSRERLANLLGDLSGELTQAGQLDEAQELIDESLAAWQSLIAEDSANIDYQVGLGWAHFTIAMRQMWWGSTDGKAEASLREAERLFTKILAQDPKPPRVRAGLSATLTNLATVLDWKGRKEESIECARRALRLSEELAEEFPDDVERQRSYLIDLQNLAVSLSRSKKETGDESGRLRLQAHELLNELVDRFPEENDFRIKHFTSWCVRAYDAYEMGDQKEAERCFKIAHQALVSFAKDRPDVQGNDRRLGNIQRTLAGLMIERGDHAGAAEILNDYPQNLRRFEAEPPSNRRPDGSPIVSKFEFYELQTSELMIPSLLLQNCARLAATDEGLSSTQRITVAGGYIELANAFQAEADRAIEAWIECVFDGDEKAGFLAAGHVDSQIEDFENLQSYYRVPIHNRQASIEVKRTLIRRAVEETTQQLADKPSQMWMSLVLSGAPPDLRAPQHALSMAERAMALAPDDSTAREILAWALFRVGHWQECIDNCDMSDLESEPCSIVTMALWKVGRQDEARHLLTGDTERLDDYKKMDAEKRSEGYILLPSAVSLERVHREAIDMIEGKESASAEVMPDE